MVHHSLHIYDELELSVLNWIWGHTSYKSDMREPFDLLYHQVCDHMTSMFPVQPSFQHDLKIFLQGLKGKMNQLQEMLTYQNQSAERTDGEAM